MVRLRVLGTLEVRHDTGDEVLLRSARTRRLLAALLVRRGEVAATDWLADVVWGDDQPANADGALQNLVSRLRTALRSAGAADDGVLVTRPPGYLVPAGAGDLDADAFETLAAQGRALLRTAPADAVELLDRGLALWRGDAFAEFAADDFARPEALRLDELRASATEDAVDALLASGRTQDALARLEPQVLRHPLRERPHAQLVLARYRAGRPAEALATYRDYRSRLDDELGLEPSEALQALEAAVLRQDRSLDPGPAAERAAGSVAAAVPAQRLADDARRRLVGREQDLADLTDLVRPGAVVTLTGPGGVGKTALATATAQGLATAYPDGLHVIELGALTDGPAVPHAVATALRAQLPAGPGPVQGLVDHLRGRRVLLVLDNCEHVVADAAGLAAALHDGCPELAVLATSRTPLEVADEQVVAVPPLPVPASVELFVTRARARAPHFRVDDGNRDAVAEVCRRLDGLPLAIELAAVRMASMSPADLADRLSWRFRLLHGGPRTATERHRTLRAVVDWSYDLLDDEQRQVFEVLSVFTGAVPLEACESLVAAVDLPVGRLDPTAVTEVVSALVDRSMLVARHHGDGTRYTMLETLRVYGQERLAGRDYADEVRRTWAGQRADVATTCERELYGARHPAAIDRLLAELDDLRAAHSWALRHDLPTAVRIVGHLALFAEQRMVGEVSRWAERTLVAAEASGEHLDVSRVQALAAGGARFRGDFEEAQRLVEAGLSGDPSPATLGLLHALGGEIALLTGRLDDARVHARLIDERAEAVGPFASLARILESLVATYDGRPAEGAAIAERIGGEAERHGWTPVLAWARYARGEALQASDPALSAALLDESVALARESRDSYLTGVALVSLASVTAGLGDPALAAARFDGVVLHWLAAGNWAHQWTTLRNVAVLLADAGAAEDSAALLGALSTPARSRSLFGADAERMAALRAQLATSLGDGWPVHEQRGAELDDDAVVELARAALARVGAQTRR